MATKPVADVRPRTPALPGSPLRLALASVLPLLLLASLLWLPGLAAPPEPLVEPLVEHAWKARAQDGLSVRRLERAVEAHRLVTGRWPTDLAELAELGWLPRSALTGHEGHPYYYARRGGAYVLLAPSP